MIDENGRVSGPTILLASGRYFDVDDPASHPPRIDDIAWSLAMHPRWSGQCWKFGHGHIFYSVAQHSTMMAMMAPPELAFAALMHDAIEFMMGDLGGPLKVKVPDYKELEKFLQRSIEATFRVPPYDKAALKLLDRRMMATERRELMNWNEKDFWGYLGDAEPFEIEIHPDEHFRISAERFLMMFDDLGGSDT